MMSHRDVYHGIVKNVNYLIKRCALSKPITKCNEVTIKINIRVSLIVKILILEKEVCV